MLSVNLSKMKHVKVQMHKECQVPTAKAQAAMQRYSPSFLFKSLIISMYTVNLVVES